MDLNRRMLAAGLILVMKNSSVHNIIDSEL